MTMTEGYMSEVGQREGSFIYRVPRVDNCLNALACPKES
jgi:hypothetical protein